MGIASMYQGPSHETKLANGNRIWLVCLGILGYSHYHYPRLTNGNTNMYQGPSHETKLANGNSILLMYLGILGSRPVY